MSYRAIAKLLNRERVPTKNGADWHASTVRYRREQDYEGINRENSEIKHSPWARSPAWQGTHKPVQVSAIGPL